MVYVHLWQDCNGRYDKGLKLSPFTPYSHTHTLPPTGYGFGKENAIL